MPPTQPAQPNFPQAPNSFPPTQPHGGFPAAPTPAIANPGFLASTPPQFSQAPRQPSQKTKGKKKNLKWLAPVVVVASILAILIPGGLLAYQFLGGNRGSDGNIVDMSWFPEDTEVVGYVDVGSFIGSTLYQQQLKNDAKYKTAMEKMQEETGLTIEDIDSITFGGKLNGRDEEGMGVLYLSKDVDFDRFKDLAKTEVNGYSVYTKGRNKFLAIDSRTLLFGSAGNVEAIANRGPVSKRRTQFDFADSGQDFFVCGVPNDASDIRKQAGNVPNFPGAPAELASASQNLQDKTQGFALGGTFSGSNLNLKGQLQMEDSTSGSSLASDLTELIKQGREEYAKNAGMLPIPPDTKKIIDQVIGSVSVGSSGSTVAAKIQLPVNDLISASQNSPFGPSFGPSMPGSGPMGGFPNFGDVFN